MAADNKAKIVIEGQDRTKAAFDSVDRSLQGLQSGIGKLTGAMEAVLGSLGIAEAFRQVGEAVIESEKSLNLLSAALRTTDLAAGRTAPQIESIVQSLTETSNFDDEAIRSAAAALLRFRDIQRDVFDDALKLAPDVAAALGGDVVSAAEQLGKALIDPGGGMKALKLAGVSLSESQIELAKNLRESGDLVGAQRVVLDAVRVSVHGLAAEMHSGLTASTADLKKAWTELMESIGKTKTFSTVANSELGGLKLVLEDLRGAVDGTSTRFQGFVAEMMASAASIPSIVSPFLDRLAKAIEPGKAEAGSRTATGTIKYAPGQSPAELKAAQRDAERLEEDWLAMGQRNLENLKKTGGLTAGQRIIASLDQELSKKLELTRVDELLLQIRDKSVAFDSESQKAQALKLAGLIDTARVEKEYSANVSALLDPLNKEVSTLTREVETFGQTKAQIEATTAARIEEARVVAEFNGASAAAIGFLEREAAARRNIAAAASELEIKQFVGEGENEKLEAQRALLIRMADAFEQGKMSAQQWSDGARAAIGNVGDGLKQTKDIAEELGMTFSSAFEDAIVGGKSFRDILKGIEADIMRIITREWVTKPFSSWLTSSLPNVGNWFTGLFGGGGYTATNWAGSPTFAGAMGGIAPGGFRAFAGGGIATRPTLGLVGEGLWNEAVVPLPNGRSIPVEMRTPARQEQRPISMTLNFALSAPVTRQSQAQIAKAAGDAISRAMRANG